MKTIIITESKIRKKITRDIFNDNSDITIMDLNQKTTKNLKTASLIVILTKKILSRNNLHYKNILSLINKKNINLIEIAFEKSIITNEKVFSKTIIHGFGNLTLDILKKIEISFRGVN